MKTLKAFYYICAYFQYFFLKCIYGKHIKIGKHVTWRRGFSVMIGENAHIDIGSECFFNNYCSLNANSLIKIGEGSIFGENVKIYDHNHRFANPDIKIKEQGFSNGEVHIGKHCWIGSNVIILKNADIGDNCVIGAGCVIADKIEDNTIVVMNRKYDLRKIRR